MSSTTEQVDPRGQILVLFAGAIVVVMIVAALAFDVGMMLVERRDQQNAADAAALHGARYILGSAVTAENAALALASQNGFDNSDPDEVVTVHIPPIHGIYRGMAGFIEVQIESTRPSIFGGIIGQAAWPVGAYAVAANQQGLTFSFGMLALDPTECKAIHISGQGVVESGANVHSNSSGVDCGDGTNIGFSRTGGGTIIINAPDAVCRSAGEIQDQGSGSMNCAPSEYSFTLPDPLRNLAAPAIPALAAPLQEVGVATPLNVPDYCPGASNVARQPSEASPRVCTLGQGGAQANRRWILSPGLYPGGLDLKGGVTAYLLPGIYWIGGGGWSTSNDASVISVPSSSDLTVGGGIMIYNSKLPASPGGPISLGGGGATLELRPFDVPSDHPDVEYDGIVIFQDRTVSSTIELNGSSSNASTVRGIVYAPAAHVQVNGSTSIFTMDQVIANTFKINGSGGTVKVLRENGVDAVISGVGLVE